MSWNVPRTINNLENELNHKTQYLDSDNNGTVFRKNITADKFIATGGGSSLLYLMSDGSTSSGSNVGTGVKNPMITNLDANNYSLTNVGTINDVDVGTLNSDLHIVKNKTQFINSSLSIIVPDVLVSTDLPTDGTVFDRNVYADKFIINGGGPSPPGYLLSDGSVVSNSDDTRIAALETKTQNISSTSSELSLSNNFKLGGNLYSTCTDATTINYKLPTYGVLNQVLTSSGNGLLKWTTPSSSSVSNGGTGTSLLTSTTNTLRGLVAGNGMAINASLTDITITNNSPASTIGLTNASVGGNSILSSSINPNFSTKGLKAGTGMTITSNSTDLTLNGPDISTKLSLSGSTMSGALTMGGQAIINAGAITGTSFIKSGGLTTQFLKANGDVDGSTYATLTQLNQVDAKTNLKLPLTGGILTGNLTMRASINFQNNGNLGMGGGLITNVGTLAVNNGISVASGNSGNFMKADGSTDTNRYVNVNGTLPMTGALNMGGQAINNAGAITGTSFIKSGGLATHFLKANGDIDSSMYLTAANIANKLSIDGTIAMTGALNMGGQAINNSGIMSAVGFVKNGGLGSEFLKANGGSDARIMSNLQVVQSSFQVPVNGITTETNLTANPDAGSYTWTDMAAGYSRKYTFYALSTRGTGNTIYTMRFKSNLGNDDVGFVFLQQM